MTSSGRAWCNQRSAGFKTVRNGSRTNRHASHLGSCSSTLARRQASGAPARGRDSNCTAAGSTVAKHSEAQGRLTAQRGCTSNMLAAPLGYPARSPASFRTDTSTSNQALCCSCFLSREPHHDVAGMLQVPQHGAAGDHAAVANLRCHDSAATRSMPAPCLSSTSRSTPAPVAATKACHIRGRVQRSSLLASAHLVCHPTCCALRAFDALAHCPLDALLYTPTCIRS